MVPSLVYMQLLILLIVAVGRQWQLIYLVNQLACNRL